MKAIHIASFAPAAAKGRSKPAAEDFDLYCTAFSALQWRKNGGEITMCCDSAFAEFYDKIGFSGVWNAIDQCVPDDLEGIDPQMFWAGAKLLALKKQSAPVVMLDTDFIAWKNPEFGEALIAAHREEISDGIYPPLSFFQTRGHILPEFSESVLPLNTAFLYIPDDDFKEFYTSQAIAFMKSAVKCGDYLKYMVFAEQRICAMCAEYTGTPVKTLLDKDVLFRPQSDFTHLWGAKQAMRDSPELRREHINKCKARLFSDFPEYSYLADIIDNVCG